MTSNTAVLSDSGSWHVQYQAHTFVELSNKKSHRQIKSSLTGKSVQPHLEWVCRGEKRTGHVYIHSTMCHPPAGINLLELACPAFPPLLHLTASLHNYWASILAEYSTDIKDTWPLSHAKTLSALLQQKRLKTRGNYKEAKMRTNQWKMKCKNVWGRKAEG